MVTLSPGANATLVAYAAQHHLNLNDLTGMVKQIVEYGVLPDPDPEPELVVSLGDKIEYRSVSGLNENMIVERVLQGGQVFEGAGRSVPRYRVTRVLEPANG
jgi:hypothetical protein